MDQKLLPIGGPTGQPQQMEITSSDNDLCARCASIDVDAIFLSRPKTYRGRLILKLSFVGDWQMDSPCSFCRLLAAVKPTLLDNSSPDDLAIYSFPLTDNLWSSNDKNVVLGILRLSDTQGKGARQRIEDSLSRTGYIASTSPPQFISNSETMRGRAIDPHQVDYSIVRNWLHHCQSKHKGSCSGTGIQQPDSLKLINCSSRRLEQGTLPTAYFALSYVWGQIAPTESASQFQDDVLPSSLPKTIEDAITVTKSLGYKYLWVDKYCINQNYAKEKMDQIRQMDLVYLNAELTIVAGAGDNSDTGLHGVSSLQRIRQPQAHVGKHQVVSLMSTPKRVILDSPWMSRGWTFQEALFSRRLLVFTEHQVYFECQSTNFCETVDLMRDWTGWNIFNSNDERRRFPWTILKRLEEYSKRRLTYECDTLNAILGVLRLYEKAKYPTYHHWGIPILPPIVKGRNGWPSPIQRRRSDGFVAGLCWQHMAPGYRRVGFPSWSWAGWNVCLRERSEEYEHGLRMQGDSNIEIFFENTDQSLLSWEVFWNSLGENPNVSPYIRLSVCTIQVRLQYDPESTYTQPDYLPSGHLPTLGSAYWASFDIKENVSIQARLYLLQETDKTSEYHMDLTSKVFTGVILGGSYSLSSNPNTFIMVAQDKGECLERIGHLILGRGHVRVVDRVSGKTLDWEQNKQTFEAVFWDQDRRLIRIG